MANDTDRILAAIEAGNESLHSKMDTQGRQIEDLYNKHAEVDRRQDVLEKDHALLAQGFGNQVAACDKDKNAAGTSANRKWHVAEFAIAGLIGPAAGGVVYALWRGIAALVNAGAR